MLPKSRPEKSSYWTSDRAVRCDGVTRREFVRLGSLGGGLASAALLWGAHLRQPGPSQASGTQSRRQRNCILIWLDGGASHLETFDPKPQMPIEVRGPMTSIATSLSGVRFGECLPELARRMDKMTLLRGVTSPLGEHNLGAQYMLTGYRPTSALEYPVIGSAISHLLGQRGDLPAHIAIPNHQVGGAAMRPNGYLPSGCSPFELQRRGSSPGESKQALAIPDELNQFRVERRAAYLKQLDRFSRELDRVGLDRDYAGLDQAVRFITSPAARQAFDLEQEPAKTRSRYGTTVFGDSCLLARRAIESGVRYVTVNFPGWDTHENLTLRLKDGYTGAREPVGLIPNLDRGLSALLQDLEERNLLEETLVVVMGEFGRTPRINALGGRDHWPRAFSVLMAGGGTPQGLVWGETDPAGESPRNNPVTPADIVATLYHQLGVDPYQELITPDGRPVRLVKDGQIIAEVTG